MKHVQFYKLHISGCRGADSFPPAFLRLRGPRFDPGDGGDSARPRSRSCSRDPATPNRLSQPSHPRPRPPRANPWGTGLLGRRAGALPPSGRAPRAPPSPPQARRGRRPCRCYTWHRGTLIPTGTAGGRQPVRSGPVRSAPWDPRGPATAPPLEAARRRLEAAAARQPRGIPAHLEPRLQGSGTFGTGQRGDEVTTPPRPRPRPSVRMRPGLKQGKGWAPPLKRALPRARLLLGVKGCSGERMVGSVSARQPPPVGSECPILPAPRPPRFVGSGRWVCGSGSGSPALGPGCRCGWGDGGSPPEALGWGAYSSWGVFLWERG